MSGHSQQGLHQDVLQPDQAPPPPGPDPVRDPPAHRHGPAQRDRDGGQEPLRNSLCPQVCDEVHVLVLTKNRLPKRVNIIFKQQFLVDNQLMNLTLFPVQQKCFHFFPNLSSTWLLSRLTVYQYQYYTIININYTPHSYIYSQTLPGVFAGNIFCFNFRLLKLHSVNWIRLTKINFC